MEFNELGRCTNIITEEITEFKFRRRISRSEMIYLIQTIADNCFDIDGEYERYHYDSALIQSILLTYTDIELPENSDEIYDFIRDNRLDMVVGIGERYLDTKEFNNIALDTNQIEFIKDESWALVKYRKEKLMNKSSLDDLVNSITEYVNKMSKQFDGLKMEDIKGFSDVGEMIGGIDKNEFMSKVIEFAKGSDK
jgi:hypothetical protein